MRQRLGKKMLRRYSKLLGMEFDAGLVRGNTDHRVDLRTTDGRTFHYWPSGAVLQAGDLPIVLTGEERADERT